jgi:hypothetical protein
MEWLLLLLAAGGGAVTVVQVRRGRGERAEDRAELASVRRLADEDVTVLGEQLQRLDAEVADRHLDEAARIDYQTALDAYESAQRSVERLRSAEQVSTVTDTLTTGRYAIACVQARVEGRPPPPDRTPCFFDPRHGPAAEHVLWTAPGRGTRRVPACAQDAARVAHHEAPQVRTVTIGSRRLPYWEAGRTSLPYSEGYFAAAAGMAWLFESPAPFWGGAVGDAGHGGFGGGDFGGGAMDAGGGGGNGG